MSCPGRSRRRRNEADDRADGHHRPPPLTTSVITNLRSVIIFRRSADSAAPGSCASTTARKPSSPPLHPRCRVERQPPPQHRSGGRGPLHAGHLPQVIAAAAGRGHRRVNISAGKRPAGQPAAAGPIGAGPARHSRRGLTGIGSDDLQVGAGAEREQRIVGAPADVPATSLGPDPSTFLHLGNRTGQIRGPVDEMVDQHNPIIPRTRSGRRVRLSGRDRLPGGGGSQWPRIVMARASRSSPCWVLGWRLTMRSSMPSRS